tara:strand:+ start:3710 stop:4483 length:774 start_codon:yes stop_codon:yes gene_type:complete
MKLSEITFQLEEIGLTKSEIKVYLALLDIGSSTTGPIIDKSQTANSKIYSVLEKLIQKGLVTDFKKEGLKYYKAANPKQITSYLEEKKAEISKQEKAIGSILPSLSLMFEQKEEDREASVFRGPKGVKAAFDDVVNTLERNSEMHIMGVYNFGEDFLKLAKYFQGNRSRKGIKINFIMNRDAKAIADVFANYPPAEVRFMEEGVVTPAIFIIYANKIIISLGDEMTMFMIKSQSAADAFRVYHKQLWDKGEKYISVR